MGTFFSLLFLLSTILFVKFYFSERKKTAALKESHADWQKNIDDGFSALNELLESRKVSWPQKFSNTVYSGSGADGAILMTTTNTEDALKSFEIKAIDGYCSTWNLELGQVLDIENALTDEFFWSHRPHLHDGDDLRKWIPQHTAVIIANGIIVPLSMGESTSFLLLFKRTSKFTRTILDLVAEYAKMGEYGFTYLALKGEIKELKKDIQQAHEEGMLQISTGIIHNIGNGIQVLQLALERLKNSDIEELDQLSELISSEILPTMRQEIEATNIQKFLVEDEVGQEYLGVMDAMAKQIPVVVKDHLEQVNEIIAKFNTIHELISLQQSFIGELGTENVVTANSVLTEVVNAVIDQVNQREIAFEQSLKSSSEIMVDPAMFRHIILMLLKHSVDSVIVSQRSKPKIRLATSDSEEDGKSWVTFMLTDNGAGEEVEFSEESMIADSKDVSQRTKDYYFCKQRIEKYGGEFNLKSDMVYGTKLSFTIPIYLPEEK